MTLRLCLTKPFCCLLLVLLGLMAAPNESSADAPAGFTLLFNGNDLTGWKGLVGNPMTRGAMSADELANAQAEADEKMRAHWSVQDGVLVFDGKGDSLCTVNDYGDFELLCDWKILAGGDSGIYLRGSPQVQIWDTAHADYFRLGAENGSGSLWNNKLNPRFPIHKADKPVGEWNRFHIRMIGERVTIHLNDQLIVDNTVLENFWEPGLPIYPRGQIELQNHGNTLYFNNIAVREIGAEEANQLLSAREADLYQPLFNGKDFTGWKGDTENYTIENGVLSCRADKGGIVFTKKEYSKYIVRTEFRLPEAGNNGMAIHYAGTGAPHVDGVELQMLDNDHASYATLDPRQYHGSVYGMIAAHRGFLRPTGEWNFQQVTVNGSKIKVELNGTTILEGDLATVTENKDGVLPAGVKRTSGHFGFAGHNSPVSFRNISIRELPGEPAAPPTRQTAISPKDAPIQLFNGKNLEGFYTWIRDSAYADPKQIFTVNDGNLHISGDGYGGIITNESYRDYRLVLEYKWGEKTWGERVDSARDSGLLLHCWGPDGGYSNTWMASVEAQIIEGGVGDILVLGGIDHTTGQTFPSSLVAEVTKDRDGETVWKKGGERQTFTGGRINWFGRDPDWADMLNFRGQDDVDSPPGDWTKMEVIASGSHLLYKVNGKVVNEAFESTPSAGKLLLQTEQAEIIVRKFELWPLGKALE